MKKFLLVIILSSCSTTLKVPKIDTNKTDKLISFTYLAQVSPFGYITPTTRDLNIAKEICISWGYKNAEFVKKDISKCLDGCCGTKQIINSYIFAMVSFHTHAFYCQTKKVVNSYRCKE